MTIRQLGLEASLDGRSDIVILRLDCANRMVTQDYRKGVYKWVGGVARAPSPAKGKRHRAPFTGRICSAWGTGTTIGCRRTTSSYPAKTSAADLSQENFLTCSYPRCRIFS